MDEEKLKRALFNVLDNALIYSGEPGKYLVHPMYKGKGGMTGILDALVKAATRVSTEGGAT